MSRILFLGPTDIEEMGTVLTKAISGWIGAWSSKPLTISCSYRNRNQPKDNGFESISGFFYIADFDLLFRKIAFQENFSLAPADEVFTYLKTAARKDLESRIKKEFKAENSFDMSTTQQERFANAPGDSNILYNFTALGSEFNLLIPAAVYDLLPHRKLKQNGRGLDTVKLSDVKLPVDILVKLDMGDYPVSTISNLSEGDVLVSKIPINQEPGVFVKDKQFATARLGKTSAQKAIVFSKAVK